MVRIRKRTLHDERCVVLELRKLRGEVLVVRRNRDVGVCTDLLRLLRVLQCGLQLLHDNLNAQTAGTEADA